MRRIVLGAGLCAALLLTACKGDPTQPAHWEKSLSKARRAQDKTKVLSQLREAKVLSPAFLPFLHAQLAEEKAPEVRQEIARLLGEIKDPSSVQPLVDAIEWGNVDTATKGMNKEITAALTRIGDARAVPTLVKLLKNHDPYTRIAAIEGLGAIRATEAVEPLMTLATDETGEPFVAKKAIQALGEIGDGRAAPALVRMMFKERRGISFYPESSFALFQLGTPGADALLPVVTKQDRAFWDWAKENSILEPAVYAKSAQVLGDLNDKRAEKTLLSQLAFQSDFLDLKLFVRMKAADALGRMRSKEAAAPIAKMLGESEANARDEYARALVWIGDREAVPALMKAAADGSWDARDVAMRGASLLGDERELPGFDSLEQQEEARTAAECKADPEVRGCANPATLTQERVAQIKVHRARLVAAQECKANVDCWVKKLDDREPEVRERAAYEVGRSRRGELVGELLKRLSDDKRIVRYAVTQATFWLVTDDKAAAKQAVGSLETIEKLLAADKGKTEFVRVNEDLRRLAAAVRRSGV